MRVLVAGGAGFIGSHVCAELLVRGHDVVCVDNLVTGSADRMHELDASRRFVFVREDVTRTPLLQVDVVLHLASPASPADRAQFPIETMLANSAGTHRLLALAADRGARFVFGSTSGIYGEPLEQPQRETYRGNVDPIGDSACYDESKRYGETLCINFTQRHELPIKVARPFNNYGPGLKITDHRVLPDFARDVFANRDIVMLSDGSPQRTFCYVADAVIGYYKALVVGRPGEAYNIGVETPEISMAQLAEKVTALGRDLFGYTGKVVRKVDPEYLIDNPERRCPIITKARTELGYDPQVLVDEGLRRSMIWYSGNREAEES